MQDEFAYQAAEQAGRWLALDADRFAHLEHRAEAGDDLDPVRHIELLARIAALSTPQREELAHRLLVERLPEATWPTFNASDLEITEAYVAHLEAYRPLVEVHPRHLAVVHPEPAV